MIVYRISSSKFADTVADFGAAYAQQNEKDFEALKNAARNGKVEAYFED